MSKGRRPNPNNYLLPLSGKPADEDVFKRINGIDRRRTGLSRIRWENAKRLLCKMASLRDGPRVRQKVLAEWLDWDVSTVRRTIADLEGLGILIATPHGHCNSYEIVFEKLWAIGAETIADLTTAVAQNEQAECSKRTSCSPILSAQVVQNDHAPLEELTPELNNKQTSSLRCDSSKASERRRLEEVLFGCKVDQPAAAVAKAFLSSCPAAELHAVVEHWRSFGGGEPHAAWGPGALYRRFENATPGMPADRGWPPKTDAWEKHVANRKVIEQTLAGRREREAAATSRFSGSMVDGLTKLLQEDAKRDDEVAR